MDLMDKAERKGEVMFEVGKKYTIFKIGEALAMTSKTSFIVKEIRPGRLGDEVIFQPKGKRKMYILPLFTKHYESAPIEPLKAAVFEGWDLPYTCDTDQEPKDSGTGFMCRTMRGNACYNFVGDPAVIRAWIDKNQLNPAFEKDRVVAITPPKPGEREEQESVVYPELVRPGHAVIDRIMSKVLA